jgi:acetyl-CoA carboxylase carboxyltransferase component
VIKTVTNEDVSFEDLGGAMTHNTKSGVAHFAVEDDEACIAAIRRLLSFLPQNNVDDPPIRATQDLPDRMEARLAEIVPAEPNKPYDIKEIVRLVVDEGDFFEVHEHFAPNIVVGFARLDGRPVGVVGNQPAMLAGVLDIKSSTKAARFVRFCDAFNIPLVTFEDVPGFLPGTEQEWGGIIRHGAKLLYAYCEATVPKLTVVVRKAYGGAYDVMSSKHIRGDYNVAWPGAELAVMGADGAVSIIYRKEIDSAKDAAKARAKLVDEYNEKFANPYVAAGLGYLDDVIEPQETRPRLIRALRMLAHKRQSLPPKKHGNIPL